MPGELRLFFFIIQLVICLSSIAKCENHMRFAFCDAYSRIQPMELGVVRARCLGDLYPIVRCLTLPVMVVFCAIQAT